MDSLENIFSELFSELFDVIFRLVNINFISLSNQLVQLKPNNWYKTT